VIGMDRGEGAESPDESGLGWPAKPFLIGIAWQGNPSHRTDRWRSFPLANFAPLAELPGVRLISLQTDDGLDQLTAAGRPFPIIDLPRRRGRDFMETAAIMTQLDLVITPDTAVAHLAGGLGRQVWVALCAVDEWRWPAGREDSPWYPTMRLFRQTKLGEWGPVFRRMVDALKRELAAFTANVRHFAENTTM
jgi:hypothetical protein